MSDNLKYISTLVGLIATLAGGWFFMDSRFAHAESAAEQHNIIMQKIIRVDKERIVAELRQLEAKEQTIGLATWEKLRKKDLERQLEELSK